MGANKIILLRDPNGFMLEILRAPPQR